MSESLGCDGVEEFSVLWGELHLHVVEIADVEVQKFNLSRGHDCELSSELMSIFMPFIDILLSGDLLMANDVDDAEMVSFFDFNVLLVVIIRKDEIGLSFIQEVNVVDFICFFENVMVMVNLHCIKFFNGPGNERL